MPRATPEPGGVQDAQAGCDLVAGFGGRHVRQSVRAMIAAVRAPA